jgi:hypothetical protein
VPQRFHSSPKCRSQNYFKGDRGKLINVGLLRVSIQPHLPEIKQCNIVAKVTKLANNRVSG